MSELYVSRVFLEVNGQEIDDFKAVEEDEYDMAEQVKLMNQTGHVEVTPRYKVTVDYVIPGDAPEFDFTTVILGTLTIDRQNGTRVTYQNVRRMKIGKTHYDGEKEAVKTITLGATGRLEQAA